MSNYTDELMHKNYGNGYNQYGEPVKYTDKKKSKSGKTYYVYDGFGPAYRDTYNYDNAKSYDQHQIEKQNKEWEDAQKVYNDGSNKNRLVPNDHIKENIRTKFLIDKQNKEWDNAQKTFNDHSNDNFAVRNDMRRYNSEISTANKRTAEEWKNAQDAWNNGTAYRAPSVSNNPGTINEIRRNKYKETNPEWQAEQAKKNYNYTPSSSRSGSYAYKQTSKKWQAEQSKKNYNYSPDSYGDLNMKRSRDSRGVTNANYTPGVHSWNQDKGRFDGHDTTNRNSFGYKAKKEFNVLKRKTNKAFDAFKSGIKNSQIYKDVTGAAREAKADLKSRQAYKDITGAAREAKADIVNNFNSLKNKAKSWIDGLFKRR